MQISGTHVVVTGGSHGIGIELAREFASRGARVTVVGRDSARLEAVAADIDGNWIQVDLADEDAVATGIHEIESRYGEVDIPRRIGPLIGLRNLPSRLQDLALLGLKPKTP